MNRNIRARRHVARAATVLAVAGVAACIATGTAQAETKQCEQTMAHVNWALANYEAAINSGNRSDIGMWRTEARFGIAAMDEACG